MMSRVNLSRFLSILCMIGMIGIIYFNPGEGIKTVASFVIILFFFRLKIDDEIAVLFFSVNLIAALNTTIVGVPLTSILEIIFIVKYFGNRIIRMNAFQLLVVLGLFVVSLMSSVALDFSVIRSLVYAVNLLMMIAMFHYVKNIDYEAREALLTKGFMSFVIGFASTLVISLLRTNIAEITHYRRFTGLWTDPNFIGFFGALSICMLIIIAGNNLKKYALFSPLIMLFLFSGYLTYSRTFIIAVVIIAIFMEIALFRSERIHVGMKFLGFFAVIAVFYLVYKYYLSGIITTRGIVDHTGRDLTNGRVDDWIRAWRVYTSDYVHMIFGIGTSTTHNTFFDFLLKYGPAGAILGVALVISLWSDIRKYRIWNNLRFLPVYAMLYIVLMLYMFTLPMLEDDVLYLLLGSIPLCMSKIDPCYQLQSNAEEKKIHIE